MRTVVSSLHLELGKSSDSSSDYRKEKDENYFFFQARAQPLSNLLSLKAFKRSVVVDSE